MDKRQRTIFYRPGKSTEGSHHLELHSSRCTVVGWILGTPHWYSEEGLSQDTWTIICLSYGTKDHILTELEDRVNRRPLVKDDTQGEAEALTPAHFLFGSSPPPLGFRISTPLPRSMENLTRRLEHRARVSQHLWSRWEKEYLTTLRDWRKRSTGSALPVEVGEVVFDFFISLLLLGAAAALLSCGIELIKLIPCTTCTGTTSML